MTYYKFAKIVNTHGIQGDLKVLADTDFADQRFDVGQEVAIMDGDQLVETTRITASRPHKGSYIIHLEGYESINQVEAFKNMHLAVHESQQEALEEDEYYYHQIIGSKVYTEDDDLLGTVKDIMELGSNDVWVVQRATPGKKDALIPFIKDIVKQVDVENKRIDIELMDGLIDDEN